MNNYYVYVYIDPRNYEEFYFGKGKGSRKDAHLSEMADSEKNKRIADIRKASLTPIIRVVARDLSEDQAFLIEKTLLWKLGRQLTNVSSGYYSDNFRPHNTIHLELSGFDFKSAIYYYNVGQGPHRNWKDQKALGFISAGQGTRWRDAMLGFREGDVVVAYLKHHGFVGVGCVTHRARPIRDMRLKGKPMVDCGLSCRNMGDNVESNDLCEYVALVRWESVVEPSEAKWLPRSGIYTTTHVRASLDGQPKTIAFLEKEFEVSLRDLVR